MQPQIINFVINGRSANGGTKIESKGVLPGSSLIISARGVPKLGKDKL